MSLLQAAAELEAVLRAETGAARQALLPDLMALMRRKQRALAVLAAAGPPADEAERAALRSMMLAAEENALVLGAVAGALQEVRDRLRIELSRAADPEIYAPGEPGRRRRPLRHTLAASIDRTA